MVVARAQETARSQGHPFLGTEHLLLALLDDAGGYLATALRTPAVDVDDIRRRILSIIGEPLDADALTALGIDLHRVRQVTEEHFGRGALESAGRPAPITGHLPLTRRFKAVLELAARAARRLGQQTITQEHLMLGILDDGGGIAVRALKEAGVQLNELRLTIATHLESDAA